MLYIQPWIGGLGRNAQYILLQAAYATSEAIGDKRLRAWFYRCTHCASDDGSVINEPFTETDSKLMPAPMAFGRMVDAAYAEYYNSAVEKGEGIPAGKDEFVRMHHQSIMDGWPIAMAGVYETAIQEMVENGYKNAPIIFSAACALHQSHPDSAVRASWLDFINIFNKKLGVEMRIPEIQPEPVKESAPSEEPANNH